MGKRRDRIYKKAGYDLRKLPLIERKAHLKQLIGGTAIQFSDTFDVDGPEMFAHACGIGLEDVVSKVRDSRYTSGRGNDWVSGIYSSRRIARAAVERADFMMIVSGISSPRLSP